MVQMNLIAISYGRTENHYDGTVLQSEWGELGKEYPGGESRCLEWSPVVGTWLCMQAFFYSPTMDEKNWPPMEIELPLGLWIRHGRAENSSQRRELKLKFQLWYSPQKTSSLPLYLHIFNTEVWSMRYGTPKAHQSPFFQELVMSVDTTTECPRFCMCSLL